MFSSHLALEEITFYVYLDGSLCMASETLGVIKNACCGH